MTSTAIDGTLHGLDPRQRTVWVLAGVAKTLVLGVAGVVGGIAGDTGWLVSAGAVVGIAGSLLAAVWAWLRWRSWRWSAWPDALEVRHGVLYQHASLVPYHRIQQIDVARGPLERLLGLSCLVLRTASATSDGMIPGIPAERADELRRLLLERAGLDDAV